VYLRAARKVRLAVVLVLMAECTAAQEVQQPFTPGIASRMLESISLDPEKRALLQAAIGKRDYAGAEELLAGEAGRQPKSQPILLVLANVLFLDGKHLNCAAVLKKAEKLAPLDERNRFLLALSYVTIGRLNWARPEFETLARSFPSNAVYPYWLARIAYRKMDIDASVAHARKAIQLDPAFMKAYDQLGLGYEALGSWDQAIAAFQEAIRLNSEAPAPSPWPSMNLGVLLLRLERLDEAEGHLRRSIRIDGNFPVAHHRLGQVLEKKDRLEEAIAEFQEAASLDPTYPDPHYALARIFRQRGDLKPAEKESSMFRNLRKADKEKGITRPD
jgi:tetratricopeptide (TPR) repeat protein